LLRTTEALIRIWPAGPGATCAPGHSPPKPTVTHQTTRPKPFAGERIGAVGKRASRTDPGGETPRAFLLRSQAADCD